MENFRCVNIDNIVIKFSKYKVVEMKLNGKSYFAVSVQTVEVIHIHNAHFNIKRAINRRLLGL